MEKMSISMKKSLFPNIFFDTNEGSLGNAENRFIRKSVFLIREGWMDGVQSGKNTFLVIKSPIGEKMVIPVFGKIQKKLFYREGQLCYDRFDKKTKLKYSKKHFL